MNPVSSLAFYCCGVRMRDAASASPLCGDDYAQLFMCEFGLDIFEKFKEEKNCNASMLVRHRIIDELLQERLHNHPDSCIITIGAGFDSRPYRLHGGTWFELDEPPIVAWKNTRLPESECSNPLQRIAVDFKHETLADTLAGIAAATTETGAGNRLGIAIPPVTVVVEGVYIYLTEAQILESLTAFQQHFPDHQIICDLVSSEIVRDYGRDLQAKVEALGACFQAVDRPENVFMLNGYCALESISIIERAVDYGINKVPKLMLPYIFNADVMGNAVYVFEPGDPYENLVL